MKMKKVSKAIVSFLLLVALCVSGIPTTLYCYAAELNENEKTEEVEVLGKIYDIGYQYENPLKVMTSQLLYINAVCEEDHTVRTTRSANGEYSIKLKQGKKYKLYVSGYVSGRLRNLNNFDEVRETTGEYQIINIGIKTKTVLGFATVDQHVLEGDPILLTKGSGLKKETLNTEEEYYIDLSRQATAASYKMVVKDDDGNVYDGKEIEYSSDDDSILTIDEKGYMSAHKLGVATVTCKIKNGSATDDVAVCKVHVIKAFDAKRDGYNFINGVESFLTDKNDGKRHLRYLVDNQSSAKLFSGKIPYTVYRDMFGETYSVNRYIEEDFWGGSCFGMAYTALLFYYDYLDLADFKCEKYNQGDSVNTGAYSTELPRTEGEAIGTYFTVLTDKNDLLELIERYQIYQDTSRCRNWKGNSSVEDVIENYAKREPYIISIRWNEKNEENEVEEVGHALVLDTTAPYSEVDGYYKLKVYDCNAPFPTQKESHKWDPGNYKNADSYLYVKKDGKEWKMEDAGLNASDGTGSKSGTTILFSKLTSADETSDLLNKKFVYDDGYNSTISFSGNSLSLCNENNSVLFELKNGEVTQQSSGIDVSTTASTNPKYYISNINENVVAKMENGGKISMENKDSFVKINAKENTTAKINTDFSYEANTAEESEIDILTERYDVENEKVTSILATGTSGANNTIKGSLNEKEEYLLQSENDTKMNLSLNTEDTEKKCEYTATEDSPVVDNITTIFEESKVKQFTVTFDSDGGSAVEKQLVNEGTAVNQPGAPVKEGYTFSGWYTSNTLEKEWDFKESVKADTTLYAKWLKNTSGNNDTKPDDSNTNNKPEDSNTNNKPNDSNTNNKPEDSNTNNQPNDGNTSNKPEDSNLNKQKLECTASYNKEIGSKAFTIKVSGIGNTISYSSSNKKVVTVNNKGSISIKGIGTSTITIKSNNQTVTSKIVVIPKKTSISSVKSAKKKTLEIKWKKDSKVSGYQIQLSLDKKFKGAENITISKQKTTNKKITNLKSNKKYYVRIRSFKKVSGKRYYSSWSAVKNKKVK